MKSIILIILIHLLDLFSDTESLKQMMINIFSSGYGYTLLSFTNQEADDIYSLLERGNSFTSLMLSTMNHCIPNHTHTCHSVTTMLGVCQSIQQFI